MILDQAHRLLLSTHGIMAVPRAVALDGTDLGGERRGLVVLQSGAPSGTVLEILTPIIPFGFDVKGNAAHWAIQTMRAALEQTLPGYLAKFDSDDNWQEFYVGPLAAGYEGYLQPKVRSRRGVRADRSEKKLRAHASAARGKAVDNWQYAFRDEAEPFYERMQAKQEDYRTATQAYLTAASLKMRNWGGAFGMHLALLCGNQNVLDRITLYTGVHTLTFPAPPLISTVFRKQACAELMAILLREGMFLLLNIDDEPPNTKLDEALTASLGFDYEGSPASFMHFEQINSVWHLHTKVVGVATGVPPRMQDGIFRLPQEMQPPGHRLLDDNLFLYATAQTFPLGAITLRMDYQTDTPFAYALYAKRSDLPAGTVQYPLVLNEELLLPELAAFQAWELWLATDASSATVNQIGVQGTWWATDLEGNESNYAFFSLQPGALSTINFSHKGRWGLAFPDEVMIVADLALYWSSGSDPVVSISFQVDYVIFGGGGMAASLRRSDQPGTLAVIDIAQQRITTVAMPPAGVSLQLWVITLSEFLLHLPAQIRGHFWVTDSTGMESNRSIWDVTMSLEDIAP